MEEPVVRTNSQWGKPVVVGEMGRPMVGASGGDQEPVEGAVVLAQLRVTVVGLEAVAGLSPRTYLEARQNRSLSK